jgi:hypothetical protein
VKSIGCKDDGQPVGEHREKETSCQEEPQAGDEEEVIGKNRDKDKTGNER